MYHTSGSSYHPSLSLHDEITKFMMYIQPTQQEIDARNDLVNRFTALIASFKSNATVRPVGSYVTGLFVPTSDIDMVLVPNDALYSSPIFARTKLSSIFYKLQGTGFASKLEDVLQATVPLIRITDKKTGIQIDLTAADTHGIEATKAVQKWTSGEDAEIIKMLVMVVKMFLSIRKCGTTYTGGLNSYVLVWMVICCRCGRLQKEVCWKGGEAMMSRSWRRWRNTTCAKTASMVYSKSSMRISRASSIWQAAFARCCPAEIRQVENSRSSLVRIVRNLGLMSCIMQC